MNTRERFKAVMSFKPFDHLPIVEWAPWWDKTIERWHMEGLPPTVTDRYDIYQHFGLECYQHEWISPAIPHAPSHGAPVMSTEADYDRIRASLYYPPEKLDKKKWAAMAKKQQTGDAVVWLTLLGPFWYPRTLFGIEPHLFGFYDQPELMKRMIDDLLEWNMKVLDRFCEFCVPDYMTFAEDMSYNHGPMISKELFYEFLAPFYRAITPELRKRGIITIVDSDGDITVPAYWFEDVGVQGILPLERQAGVDIAKLRAEHPQMLFIGHFDKMTMNQGEAAMRAEFERLLPTAAQGGFIISVDHQTPPGVSYQDYQLYLTLFREYAAKAGIRT